MTPKNNVKLNRDIQSILAAAAFAVAKERKKGAPAEPEEMEDQSDLTVYGLVANGCGYRDAARENTDFISPLLLAA